MNTNKFCKYCNSMFIPSTNNQLYCKGPHYMNCPVCGKQYLVTNNENLKRPPVACSYECRKVRREQTSIEKYGIKVPGNTIEARAKSKKTMQERYGVDYALASKEIYDKAKQTLIHRYGVDNIRKLNSTTEIANDTRRNNWINLIHSEFPLKMKPVQLIDKLEEIDNSKMSIYILREKISNEFLCKYGFKIAAKPGKIHLSLGLVYNKVVYQVIRFEKHNNEIILSNLGIREGFVNPNNYDKLINFATNVKGIDYFKAFLPRHLATEALLKSLSLRKIKEGEYKVYWIKDDGTYKELTMRDDIKKMKSRYDYVTSDYIDAYEFEDSIGIKDDGNVQFLVQNSHI